MNKISTYLKESMEEMKKVTWPTKKETYHYTLMIIIISLGVALFLGLLDTGFNAALQSFVNKF
jgi:preprotein translocase subunit SecE